MKNFKTFEEFVNENYSVNEAKAKLPSKVSTVVKKIKAKDPWSIGDEIATMFEENWDDIVKTLSENADMDKFRDALGKKPYVEAICKKNKLANDWFLDKIFEILK